MSFLGNLVWFIFGGFIISIEYFIAGLLMCLTIIGIPWGIEAIKLGGANLAPFGKDVVPSSKSPGGLDTLLNIIWILIGGIWISLTHLLFGAVLFITIVGIPFAQQHFKMMRLSFAPFGYELK